LNYLADRHTNTQIQKRNSPGKGKGNVDMYSAYTRNISKAVRTSAIK